MKQSELAAQYIDKYPNHGSQTIAKVMFKENKRCFASLNSAICAVRRERGAMGNKHRKECPNKVLKKATPASSYAPFAEIPEGITHFDEWGALQLQGDMRVGILSDTHIPYHDREALLTALKHFKKINPTHIILNGDIADCFAVSFWEKDPRQRDFNKELKVVREFLNTIRNEFKNADILYKVGNHEERYERYLSVKAPELLGVAEFQFAKLLRFDELNIVNVGEKRPIRIGKLNVIHGHEFRWGITSPVNPARGFYQRGKEHCLGGHLHQPSYHSEKSMNDSIIACWSTGCLCDLHPDYSPINKWGHGFATVETQSDGSFEVQNHTIINGKLYGN